MQEGRALQLGAQVSEVQGAEDVDVHGHAWIWIEVGQPCEVNHCVNAL